MNKILNRKHWIVFMLIFVSVSSIVVAQNEIKPFAGFGSEKMIYDIRMGPQAIYYDNKIYIVYHAGSVADNRIAHPYIICYDIKQKSWSKAVKVGDNPIYNHHYAPVLWIDGNGFIHILYQCHMKTGGKHIVSTKAGAIDSWQTAPEISNSISYPKIFPIKENRFLLYYRTQGHLGYWGYRISDDGGFTWGECHKVTDFNSEAKTETDQWSGSYHSAILSSDNKKLYISFIYWDERKIEHPVYGINLVGSKVGNLNRKNLYFIELDIESGKCKNNLGEKLEIPLNREGAEVCKLIDTDYQLTNMPSMVQLLNGNVGCLLPISDASPWDCKFYFRNATDIYSNEVEICKTNSIWSGNLLLQSNDTLYALVISGEKNKNLTYGGGELLLYASTTNGQNWSKLKRMSPQRGLLYNNPQPVYNNDGSLLANSFIVYGWQGPNSIEIDSKKSSELRGKAFLYLNGNWK